MEKGGKRSRLIKPYVSQCNIVRLNVAIRLTFSDKINWKIFAKSRKWSHLIRKFCLFSIKFSKFDTLHFELREKADKSAKYSSILFSRKAYFTATWIDRVDENVGKVVTLLSRFFGTFLSRRIKNAITRKIESEKMKTLKVRSFFPYSTQISFKISKFSLDVISPCLFCYF